MVAVAIYLMSDAVDVIFFFVPAIGRYIETSNNRICTYLSWWTQVIWLQTDGMMISLTHYVIDELA